MASKRYTNDDIVKAVSSSKSMAEVCRKLGLSERGSNPTTIKRKIKELNLDTSHFTGQRWNKGQNSFNNPKIKRTPLSKILVENSGWSSDSIKKRLIKEGVKQYKCESCGLTSWGGYPIPLELHHKNGVHKDNRFENLVVLCPNCHAMTENFAKRKLGTFNENQNIELCTFEEPSTINQLGNIELSLSKTEGIDFRYKKPKVKIISTTVVKELRYCKVCGKELAHKQHTYCSQKCAHKYVTKRPVKEDFIAAIATYKSNIAVGKHFGVSDSAVVKWKKYYNLK